MKNLGIVHGLGIVTIFMVLCTCWAQKKRDANSIVLEIHNTHRELHQVPLLKSNDDLRKKAIACAKNNAQNKTSTEDCGLDKAKYGQNVLRGQFKEPGGERLIALYTYTQLWYQESRNYDFKTGKSSNGRPIGNFTQMVWKYTTELGCGTAHAKDHNRSTLVCLYKPPGNKAGRYTKNVFPKKSKS